MVDSRLIPVRFGLHGNLGSAASRKVSRTLKVRVFVSSVQKELEDERLIIRNLIDTDSFLSAHCNTFLYELEPASPDNAIDGCIEAVETCQVYVLIAWQQYGAQDSSLSVTHREYRRAKELSLPVLVFIKGERTVKREAGTEALLKEVETDGYKYKRFGNIIALQKEVRAALVKLLQERFGVGPSSDENEIAEQTIEATSIFESQPMTRILWEGLDHQMVRRILAAAEGKSPEQLTAEDLLSGASLRGLVWREPDSNKYYATAAGTVRENMLNHGLSQPILGSDTGYFQVTFPGPGDDLECIKVPASAPLLVTPAIEAQLNERQRKIVELLAAGERITSRRCETEFLVTRDTAARDFNLLIKLGLARREGKGRATYYVLATKI